MIIAEPTSESSAPPVCERVTRDTDGAPALSFAELCAAADVPRHVLRVLLMDEIERGRVRLRDNGFALNVTAFEPHVLEGLRSL